MQITGYFVLLICIFSSRTVGAVSFSQTSYSFTPSSCNPGVIAGQTNAPGTTYYTVANPNQYLGVNSNNGQILLINYLTINVPQTVSIKSYVGPGFSGDSATTQVTVTCLGTSGGSTTISSIGTGSGPTGTATGIPVASQVPYVITAANCNIGGTVGTVTVTNSAQVVFGAATSGTAFLVSSTGVITLSRAITPGTYTIVVTATNPYGTTTIPVTITAGCTSSGSGTGTGTGTGSGGSTVPVFTSTSYRFNPTGTTCVAGAIIGVISVSSTSGTPSYAISPANAAFAISNTGQLTLTGNPVLTTGSTYTFSVLATNSIGTSVVPVTVIAGTCSGTGSPPGTTTGTFKFQQSSFILSPSTCTPGTTIGTFTVLYPPGTVTYSIDAPNLGYTISQTGLITIPASGLVAGTIIVRAFSNGQTVTTSVSISTAACGGGTGTGTTGNIIFSQPAYTFQMLSGCTAFGVVGQVAATTTPATNGPVTFSLPVTASNNFGIDPNSGMIYTTVANSQCNVITVTAKNAAGQTTTSQVTINCTGSSTCSATATTASSVTTTCQPGAFGCGDIG